MIYITALNTALGGGEVHLKRLFESTSDEATKIMEVCGIELLVRSATGPLTNLSRGYRVKVKTIPNRPLPSRVHFLLKLFSKTNPTVVHINALPRDLDVLIASTLASVPRRIVHLHSAQFGHELKTVRGSLAKLAVLGLRFLTRSKTVAFLATSKKAMVSFSGKQDATFVWAPPVLPSSCSIGPGKFHYPKTETVRIAYIGRFHKSNVYTEPKNFELVCQITNILKNRKGHIVELLSIGDGNSVEQFKKEITLVSGGHNHILECRDPWVNIGREMILIAPSRHEGFSLVVAEAQQRGVRTIISDAIPEEAVFAPEFIRRMQPSSTVNDWVDAILEFNNTTDIELIRKRDPCGPMTAEGHWAVMISSYKGVVA
jgi:hypothetical protein